MAIEDGSQFLCAQRFPRSNDYHPGWLLDPDLRAHPLWLVEWLSARMRLEKGMRVLDLGSTKARSSIFLAREMGVEVWAADPVTSASDNRRRIAEADCTHSVFPIQVDARRLPFAEGFFDAIICMDVSDSADLSAIDPDDLIRLVKPGGEIGVVSTGIMGDMRLTVPLRIVRFAGDRAPGALLFDAWRKRLEKAGKVDCVDAGLVDEGWALWLSWAEATGRPAAYLHTLRSYGPRYLGYYGLTARRTATGPSVAPRTSPDQQGTEPRARAHHPLLRAVKVEGELACAPSP